MSHLEEKPCALCGVKVLHQDDHAWGHESPITGKRCAASLPGYVSSKPAFCSHNGPCGAEVQGCLLAVSRVTEPTPSEIAASIKRALESQPDRFELPVPVASVQAVIDAGGPFTIAPEPARSGVLHITPPRAVLRKTIAAQVCQMLDQQALPESYVNLVDELTDRIVALGNELHERARMLLDFPPVVVRNADMTPEQVEKVRELGRSEIKRYQVADAELSPADRQRVADDIAAWLEDRCRRTRERYGMLRQQVPPTVLKNVVGEELMASILRSGAWQPGRERPDGVAQHDHRSLLRRLVAAIDSGRGVAVDLEMQIREAIK